MVALLRTGILRIMIGILFNIYDLVNIRFKYAYISININYSCIKSDDKLYFNDYAQISLLMSTKH